MAKLPQYRQQAVEQQFTAGAAPVDNSLAQGLGQFAQGVGQFAQAQQMMVQRESRDYTLENQNQTAVGLTAEKETLSTNATSGKEYLDGVKTYIDTQRNVAMENAPSEKAAKDVKEYYDRLEASELERAIPVASKMTATKTANAVRTNVNILTNQTYRDPTSYEQNLEQGTKTILESDLAESLKPAAIAEFKNTLNVQRVQGLTTLEPKAALSQLESGRYDADLNPQQLVSLTESARRQVDAEERQRVADQKANLAEAQKKESAKNAVLQSELEIGISRGQLGYAEVERALEAGVITPAKRTQLTQTIDKRIVSQEKLNKGMEGVSAALNGGQPLDYANKDHQKAVDAYYSTMPDNDASIITLASATKVIPSQVETKLNSGLRGSTEQRVEAANTIALLNASAPEVVASLPADTKSMGIGISRLVAAGVDPARASDLVHNAVYNTSKEQKNVLKTQLTQKDMTSKKSVGFNKAIDKISDSFFSPTRTPSMNSMQAEYNTAVNDYYLLTHDIDTAMELASTDVSKVWGTTWVDGKERVMKYSPEKMYGNGKESPWIYKQLESELSEIGVTGKYTLQADATTAREDRPSYMIMTDSDGVMMPLMVNGQIQRYTPEFSITEDARIMEQQKVESVERARRREATLKNYGGKFPKPKYGSYGYEVPNAN